MASVTIGFNPRRQILSIRKIVRGSSHKIKTRIPKLDAYQLARLADRASLGGFWDLQLWQSIAKRYRVLLSSFDGVSVSNDSSGSNELSPSAGSAQRPVRPPQPQHHAMLLSAFSRVDYKDVKLVSLCAEHIYCGVLAGAGSGYSPPILDVIGRQMKKLLPNLDAGQVAVQKAINARHPEGLIPSGAYGAQPIDSMYDMRDLTMTLVSKDANDFEEEELATIMRRLKRHLPDLTPYQFVMVFNWCSAHPEYVSKKFWQTLSQFIFDNGRLRRLPATWLGTLLNAAARAVEYIPSETVSGLVVFATKSRPVERYPLQTQLALLHIHAQTRCLSDRILSLLWDGLRCQPCSLTLPQVVVTIRSLAISPCARELAYEHSNGEFESGRNDNEALEESKNSVVSIFDEAKIECAKHLERRIIKALVASASCEKNSHSRDVVSFMHSVLLLPDALREYIWTSAVSEQLLSAICLNKGVVAADARADVHVVGRQLGMYTDANADDLIAEVTTHKDVCNYLKHGYVANLDCLNAMKDTNFCAWISTLARVPPYMPQCLTNAASDVQQDDSLVKSSREREQIALDYIVSLTEWPGAMPNVTFQSLVDVLFATVSFELRAMFLIQPFAPAPRFPWLLDLILDTFSSAPLTKGVGLADVNTWRDLSLASNALEVMLAHDEKRWERCKILHRHLSSLGDTLSAPAPPRAARALPNEYEREHTMPSVIQSSAGKFQAQGPDGVAQRPARVVKKVRKHFLLGGHLIPERLYEREKCLVTNLVRDDSSNGISSHVAGGLGTCDRFARKEVLIERAMKSKKLPFKRVAGVTLAVDHEANKAYWPLTTSDFLEPLSRLNAEDFTSSSGLSKEHSNRKSIGWLDSRSFLQQYVLDRFLHKEGLTLVPFVVDVDGCSKPTNPS